VITSNPFFEVRLEKLFSLAEKADRAFRQAGLEYRVVGGLATYLYVERADPDAGRLTRDVDIAVRRSDLSAIKAAVRPYGFTYRHVAGVDMLLPSDEASAKRAIHLVFSGERVRPEYLEAVPDLGPAEEIEGICVIALVDLVKMKLTSFHAKDEAHLIDLDEAGLITTALEAQLSPALLSRLAAARLRAKNS
jgi:hypothetical protein